MNDIIHKRFQPYTYDSKNTITDLLNMQNLLKRPVCVLSWQVLRQKEGRYGVARVCNGGGGASAVVLELM
jgi:hypothetical protein